MIPIIFLIFTIVTAPPKHISRPLYFAIIQLEKMGGAVDLQENNMTLTGYVIFIANKAQSGGGISIQFTSEPRINAPNVIVFQEPLNITFYKNKAKKLEEKRYIFGLL